MISCDKLLCYLLWFQNVQDTLNVWNDRKVAVSKFLFCAPLSYNISFVEKWDQTDPLDFGNSIVKLFYFIGAGMIE